jgi:hypothetical protein
LRAHDGQTGGVLDCLEAAVPDGWGLPPHRHRNSEEVLIVLDGALAVEADGRRERLGPGDFAVFPRGTAHGFAAKGPSRFWVWFVPPLTGGIGAFLEALAQLPLGPPEPAELEPILERHDHVLGG